jgi:hypothetical protein
LRTDFDIKDAYYRGLGDPKVVDFKEIFNYFWRKAAHFRGFYIYVIPISVGFIFMLYPFPWFEEVIHISVV